MKNFIINFAIILISFSFSCCIGIKTLRKEKLQFGKNKYEIYFSYKNYKKQVIFNGNVSSEYRFNIADSIVVFITENKSATPLINRFLQPRDYLRFIDEDNLKYEFTENNHVFCLEKKENIIIGYINVPKDNKDEFENILLTFKKL